jgi:hypothetical protein
LPALSVLDDVELTARKVEELTMARGFWVGLICAAALGAIAVWLTATSTFLYRHPTSPNTRIVMDYTTGSAVVAPLPGQTSPALLTAAGTRPRIVTGERLHDFGLMNPFTMGHHEFVVRNEGAAPLVLRLGPTTCNCTVSGVAKKKLEPGESTTVSLDWDSGRHPEFLHSATIHTNDPDRQSVHFTVRGRVRVLAAAEPNELPLPAADPASRGVFEVFLHSQLWREIDVQSVESKLADFSWRVEDVDPALVPELSAQAVKKLHCEFKNPGAGRFAETLQITMREAGSERAGEQIVIPVQGSIKRRLSFYGPAIDEQGLINLGNISEGQSKEVKLIAKVRDDVKELENLRVEVFPRFAQATMEPHPDGQPGMYNLVIAIPAGSEPCQYKADPAGRIVIHSDHPRIGDVELGLSFAIVPK